MFAILHMNTKHVSYARYQRYHYIIICYGKPHKPVSSETISRRIKKKYTTSLHWGWYEISRGIKENSIWNFHTGVTKKNLCGISRGLGFGVRISKRCNVILHNFQGCSYDLPGISRGKVNKQKNSRGNFQKSMSLMPPTLFFFWNSPLYLNFWRYFL